MYCVSQRSQNTSAEEPGAVPGYEVGFHAGCAEEGEERGTPVATVGPAPAKEATVGTNWIWLAVMPALLLLKDIREVESCK